MRQTRYLSTIVSLTVALLSFIGAMFVLLLIAPEIWWARYVLVGFLSVSSVCTVVLILKNIRLGVLTGAGVCAVLLLRLAELDSILNIILVFGLLATAEYYIRLK